MLIVLSDRLLECDLGASRAEPLRCALSNLGLAHREGKHILSFSRGLQKKLRELHPQIGSDISRVFSPASWDRDSAASLREEVLAYIEVHEAGYEYRITGPPAPQPGDPVVFHVDLNFFRDSLGVQATQLVGEDLRDADLYHALARAYAYKFKSRSYPALRCVSGGGVNTEKMFRRCGADGITLCVADTDADRPDASPKETGARTLSVHDELKRDGRITDLHLLRCHELENLWPERLVVEAAASHADQQVRELVQQHLGRFGRVDHVDLKKLVGKHMPQWMAAFIEPMSQQKLAEYCFADDHAPYLAELGLLLWSWGACPPRGKQRS